ncbi:hypothetical protein EVAR_48814_1 [Eumeta japonica]|uniref:Uncharacterized protein n=1 Tax=Eumeta variegata TaxID=151549 RepID=A0A4C1Y0N0_EUMVA|nr:hypothetical protein EVAR_48814_1 [Eumeta japonica]
MIIQHFKKKLAPFCIDSGPPTTLQLGADLEPWICSSFMRQSMTRNAFREISLIQLLFIHHEAELELLEHYSTDLRAPKKNLAPPRPKLGAGAANAPLVYSKISVILI